MEPSRPTQRVSNVMWGGYRLADLVAAVRPRDEAKYLWSFGADWGTFDGIAIDAYAKDLPLGRICEDVLIAESMNGAPLTPEHGFPLRLVVPGFYGTNSVKWLTRMTFASERSTGPFTTRWYNDPVMEDEKPTGRTQPVWAVAPQSIIVDPWPRAQVKLGEPVEIWGWAWADPGIASVTIETDAGLIVARVEPRRDRSWQRFVATWHPDRVGKQRLGARAVDTNGAVQPDDGARNAILRVEVVVE
jgi:DMSO/TMAO reductase YedYZ molybdopterin-dependent catalytic subunit